jgi:hypothetical protein
MVIRRADGDPMSRPYLPPGRFAIRVVNPLVRWAGAASTLEVRRRATGLSHRVPVNVLRFAGARYLIALRGETEWARNLRKSGTAPSRGSDGDVFSSRWLELPVKQRRPVIAAYGRRWKGPARRFFDRLPDPARHPVFRLDPAE